MCLTTFIVQTQQGEEGGMEIQAKTAWGHPQCEKLVKLFQKLLLTQRLFPILCPVFVKFSTFSTYQ